MALNGSLNKIKKSLGLEPNLFFAVYELVIYFEKCATGSNFCGAFEAISHFLGALVVHSAEWATSPGYLWLFEGNLPLSWRASGPLDGVGH